MSKIKKVDEIYMDTLRNPYAKIYENPTPEEFSKVFMASPDESIRFLAVDSPSKKVYIFSSEAFHLNVAIFIKVPSMGTLTGNAVRSGKYWYFDNSSLLEFYLGDREIGLAQEILRKDWRWVNEFISIDDRLAEYREEFIRLCDE